MKLLHRTFFTLLCAGICAVSFSCASRVLKTDIPATCLWNGERLAAVKETLAAANSAGKPVATGSPADAVKYTEAYAALVRRANRALEMANPSVMDKIPVPASGDKHDYMSLARYFWPDPTSPDGLPYISRDGESNPELELYDRNRLGAMASAVTNLSLAFYLGGGQNGGERKYADKAVSLLRTWFLDPATRMNPNMTYAQMVPGHNGGMGRQYGIIDGYSFVEMLDGVILLETEGAIPANDLAALRRWFAEYGVWLMESDHGRNESLGANNHSVAYDVQLLMYSLFAGETATARRVIEEFPARRLQPQILPDGSQPEELGRTKAYWYSVYNLAHMLDVCDMASRLDIDLYHTAGPDGNGSIEQVIRFLVPWIGKPDEWPWQQINDWEGAERLMLHCLLRASKYNPEAGFEDIYNKHSAPENENGMFILLNM